MGLVTSGLVLFNSMASDSTVILTENDAVIGVGIIGILATAIQSLGIWILSDVRSRLMRVEDWIMRRSNGKY